MYYSVCVPCTGYPPATVNLGQIFQHGFKDGQGTIIEPNWNTAVEVYSRHADVEKAKNPGSTSSGNGFEPCTNQLAELFVQMKSHT